MNVECCERNNDQDGAKSKDEIEKRLVSPIDGATYIRHPDYASICPHSRTKANNIAPL